MSTRAISADVKAANSKLAQFLRRQEEEENILTIGKRKPKQMQEERLPGGRARWQLEPDWTAPTPMVDRPRTVTGATSFHFSYISVSKQAVPTSGGQPVSGTFGNARSAALEHSKYIERDGAAEVSRGADHAAYVERPEAVELMDPAGLIAEAHERQISAIINETPTADEAELLGIEAVAPEGIPSVFSNISDDPFERQEFWRAVERCEATPRSHRIILEPDVAPAWWRELETTDKLDPDFKHHALQVAEAYRQHLAQPLVDGVRPAFKVKPFPVSAEKAGKVIESAQRMANYNDYAPPFEFKSGRGGRVQFRMVAELPYEITAEDRALIVQNFCDHIGGLEERRHLDGTPYKTGLMYTAVIHAPDSHNDSRNYHLHIVAYDRPCRYLPEHGMWDLEVEERYMRPGSGSERVRHPYRQLKIGEVSQGSAKTGKEKSGKDFIPGLRSKFAEINNAVLKARGVKRRLDPRKYSDMGIDRTPTEHLGTKAAALEAIGVPTAVGQLNALAIWSDAERAIKRQAVQAGKTYAATQGELDKVARAITAVDPNAKHVREYRAMLAERERLIADVAEDREGIMTFDHLEAKAKSRAFRTRQTCLQFLADIENGKADRNTKMMRLAIQDRWKGAQQHIEAVDKALAPHRAALAKAARDIETREARILEIDTAIQPVKAVLEARLAAAGQSAPTGAEDRSTATKQAPLPTSTNASPAANEPIDLRTAKLTKAADNAPQEGAEPVVAERAEAADVAPASIEGLVIVEPTIAPRAKPVVDQTALDQMTPEGLHPLRPAEAQAPIADTPEVIVADIDQPLPGQETCSRGQVTGAPSTTDQSLESSLSTPSSAEPVVHGTAAAPQPIELKVECPGKVVDPALVHLPIQEPPVKPGTTKASYADFDALVVRVMNDRIPIRANRQANGHLKFTVPLLDADEQALLSNPRFAHRANKRLAAIESTQQNEIQRVVRWVQTHGRLPDMLRLENRSASLGRTVKQSIRTMFRHWGRHDDVISAFREESSRRIELATEIAARPTVAPERVDRDLEARKAEAANLYPTPDKAYTQEVEDFIKLLLEAAPLERLRQAADEIHASARAREDVNKQNVHLATAYRQFVDGVDQRNAQRFRNGKGADR